MMFYPEIHCDHCGKVAALPDAHSPIGIKQGSHVSRISEGLVKIRCLFCRKDFFQIPRKYERVNK